MLPVAQVAHKSGSRSMFGETYNRLGHGQLGQSTTLLHSSQHTPGDSIEKRFLNRDHIYDVEETASKNNASAFSSSQGKTSKDSTKWIYYDTR